MKTYTELMELDSYEDRLAYLRLDGVPAELTFGPARSVNQKFYNSPEWKRVRDAVIARDLGYDLAVPGRDISGRVLVHHMNPIRPLDILHGTPLALDPEHLITVSHETHLAIHFGSTPEEPLAERKPGDTKLW